MIIQYIIKWCKMFLGNFKNFISYYGKGRYLKLVGFTFLSLIAGMLEFIGIALIYPFIILIIQPEAINITKFIKFENNIINGLIIGLIVLLIFILKNLFIIFSLYRQSRFVMNWKQSIVSGFMGYYLYAPYKDTMRISPNDKIYTIETLVNQTLDNFVLRVMNLFTNLIIISMVILLLLIKFPIPAMITIVFVCIAAFIQNKFFKSRIAQIAVEMSPKSHAYQTALLQNINNIKEIKMLSSENIFYENYVNASKNLKDTQILHSFYCSIPPYIVEILVVCSLILMAYILSVQNISNNSNLIASFAIVVAALFRVAPALNRIQSSIIAINSARNFVKLLNNEHERYIYKIDNKPVNEFENLKFSDKIEFKNIKFSYDDKKTVINNVSFSINKGDFVGIIGLSGAGKSTLADILVGLLPADSGHIYVDNTELSEKNYAQFRRIIGYVPQQINILDKSIKENIAWGCKEINDNNIIKALKDAKIYDVIEEFGGIDSNIIIGSNGLSQGQKQRLAIARALYRNPEIIILDEATSALDVQVENEITEMLTNISNKKTIIAIAHRLSTLKACNKLIYIKEGQIVDIGTFEELSSKYEDFASLVKLSNIN